MYRPLATTTNDRRRSASVGRTAIGPAFLPFQDTDDMAGSGKPSAVVFV